MRTDNVPRPHAPSGPASVLIVDEDVLAMEASHLAGLHRGLLILLSLAILMLLPAIVWSGARGASWTGAWSGPARAAVRRPLPPARARVPLSREANADRSLLR